MIKSIKIHQIAKNPKKLRALYDPQYRKCKSLRENLADSVAAAAASTAASAVVICAETTAEKA